MVSLQIADMFLRMNETDFETALQNFQDNYNYPNITHKSSQLRMQKSGQEMLKVTIQNDHGSVVDIVGERDGNGDVVFKPIKIRSINETFYMSVYRDPDDIGEEHDPSMFLAAFMSDLCTSHNGTFAYQDSAGNIGIIKDGQKKKVASMALVDEDGEIYSTSGAKSVGAVDEDDGPQFHIKNFWQNWLKQPENSEIRQQYNAIADPNDKFNFLGKALVDKRMNGEITFDEFDDLFKQICGYGLVTNSTLLNFLKMIT